MTYLDTPIEATVSEYSPTATSDQVKQMTYDLSRLEQHLEHKDSIINSFTKQLREHESKLNAVKAYVKEMIDSEEEISKDILRIVKILDITLTKTYDMHISVIYRGTVEIPLDEDINKFSDHVEFEFSDKGEDDWDVDIFQYDVDVNWDEV